MHNSLDVPVPGLQGAVVIVTGITLPLSPAAAFMTGAVIPLDGGQVIDRE